MEEPTNDLPTAGSQNNTDAAQNSGNGADRKIPRNVGGIESMMAHLERSPLGIQRAQTAPSIPRSAYRNPSLVIHGGVCGGDPPSPDSPSASQYVHVGSVAPSTSGAINKMKASLANRERENRTYRRRFPKSAQSPRSPDRAGAVSVRTINESSNAWSMSYFNRPSSPRAAYSKLPFPPREPQILPNHHSNEIESPQSAHLLISRAITPKKGEGSSPPMGVPIATQSEVQVLDFSRMLPKVPSLPSPTPLIQTYPVGAHNSGFYSKYQINNSKSQMKTPTITAMIRDAEGSHRKGASANSGNREDSEDDESSVTAGPLIKERQSLFVVSDSIIIDNHLNILADPITNCEKAVATLSSLLAFMDESATYEACVNMLYEKGAVNIIIMLMKQFPESPTLQISATFLLEPIVRSNPLAGTTLIKNDGVHLLLNANRTAGKALAEVRRKNIRQSGVCKAPGKIRRSSSFGIHGPVTNLSLSLQSLNNDSDAEADVHVATSSGANGRDSLINGLLTKYYEPSFQGQLEKMDMPGRAEVIQHLLNLYEKIDRVLYISTTVSLDLDLDYALSEILDDAYFILQAELVMVFLVDPETGELVLRESSTANDNDRSGLKETRFLLSEGIAGYVAQKNELTNLRDVLGHPEFSRSVDTKDGLVVPHSLLSIPIRTKDDVVKGVLQAVNKVREDGNPLNFDQEDVFLSQELAKQAAIILNNCQIYDAMKKAQKRVGVLLDTTRSLGSTLELDRLIKMIMEAAKELLVADRCTLFLFDSQEKQLCAHIQGKDTDTVQEIRIPMGSGIAGYVFTSGESVNIPDAYKDSRFNPEVDRQTGYVTKNILCMPIKNISGECIGVTQMINRRGGPFGLDDEKILSSFSAQAAVAIEKSYLFKKTEDMRSYLQGILSSITNCVITLNDAMHMRTMNRNWFMNALGLNEATMMENPVTAWMTEENSALLKDILEVNSTRLQVYVSEYELKGPKSTTYINYQIMPIIGEKRGVVLILEDISSEKRAIMTLGRYMSPALAKQVMEEDGSQLGGTRKKVAIVFSDIRSFTKMSESMEPHEVVELLNHHFSDQVNAILAEQGILDKYIGDATMAVFGVPFVSPDDSIHACNAALRMQDSLKILNQTREMQGLRSISIGLGVNTGVVLSGNIGSTKRMEFSCIGDAVNLASRTEGLTKLYHVTILITEFTKAETNDNFITREVDWVIVTGKSQRVVIHELLGKKGDLLSDDLMDGLLLYKQGLELYRSRQFAKAITKFQKAIDIADDGPSKTLMDRCRRFIENPPEEDWDGVYICESK